MENLGPHILFMIGPLPVTTTVVATWLVMGFLVLVSILITRKLQFLPGRWQNLLELFVEGIMNMINDMAPSRGRIFLPLVGTLALFIGAANLTGLIPGLEAPTSDFNTALALALIVFAAVPYYGVKIQGWKNYLKTYISPSPVMAPFHIISEITRTFSLALRLFGNILGEEIGMCQIMFAIYS
jgi:F-type H+-transporting ATPase subunit a